MGSTKTRHNNVCPVKNVRKTRNCEKLKQVHAERLFKEKKYTSKN